MAVTQYTMMIDNNGQQIPVEQDRVERFLGLGWTLVQSEPEKKSPRKGSKNKITAEAQVTSTVVEEIEDPDWIDDLDDELPQEEEN